MIERNPRKAKVSNRCHNWSKRQARRHDDTDSTDVRELTSTLSLEVLNSSLVLLGLLASAKRAEVLSLAGLWVFLARVESVFA